MENPTQIFTAAIAGHIYEIIRASKIGQMIFQQSEHSICTSYIFTASMDRVSVANQNDLSCPLSPPPPPPPTPPSKNNCNLVSFSPFLLSGAGK